MTTPAIHVLLEPFVTRFVKSDELPTSDSTKDLRNLIEAQSQQMQSQKAFVELMSKFSASANELLNVEVRDQTSSRCKLAGILILDCLIDINDENSSNRRIEISNSFRRQFENEKLDIEIHETIFRSIASSMGHITRVALTTDIEFLHSHYFDFSIKLLVSPSDSQRLCGSLLLSQLALNSPAMIFAKRKTIFLKLWPCLCDKIFHVRCSSAELLEIVLKLVAPRDDITDYCKQALLIMKECLIPHVAHEKLIGILLFYVVIGDGDNTGHKCLRDCTVQMGLSPHDIIWKFLQKKDSRDIELRRRVIDVMPRLASIYNQTFLHPNLVTKQLSFLLYFVRHLITIIKQKKDRQLAYSTLGKLFYTCSAIGNTSLSLIEEIMVAVQDGFRDPFSYDAVQCFAHMINLSPVCRRYVTRELVDSMFRGGLTEELVVTLNAIIKYVPHIRSYVQKQLSASIANVLQKYLSSIGDTKTSTITPPKVQTQPAVLPRHSIYTVTPYKQSMWSLFSSSTTTNTPELSLTDQLIFAMSVIAKHDFFYTTYENRLDSMHGGGGGGTNGNDMHQIRSNSVIFNGPAKIENMNDIHSSGGGFYDYREDPIISLLSILRDAVIKYLVDQNPIIRSAAAMSCLAVLDKIVYKIPSSSTDAISIACILERLLQLGVGDNNADIRCKVFLLIQPSLDHLIVKTEHFVYLLEGLNDEQLEVRAATMSVIARVAHIDPLRIMPIICLTMERLIKQLNFSKDLQSRQESVVLLQAIVKGASSLIVPYVTQILNPLIHLLSESSTNVIGMTIATLAEIAVAAPEVVQTNVDKLRPRMIQLLNDSTSLYNREIAAVAIGKYMSSVATIANEPYTTYPNLFEGLVRAIQTESEQSNNSTLQMEAMRTAGLLGAVDPSLYSQHKNITIAMNTTSETKTLKPDHFDDFIAQNSIEFKDISNINIHEKRMTKIEKYYFSVVISELKDTLLDPSLFAHHQTVLAIATKIIRQVGYQAYPFIHEYMNGLITRLNEPDTTSTMKEYILDHISMLILVIGSQMRYYTKTIINVINEFYTTHLTQVFKLVEATHEIFSLSEFHQILQDISMSLITLVSDEMNEERKIDRLGMTENNGRKTKNTTNMNKSLYKLSRTLELFQTIVNIKQNLGEYRLLFLDVVVRVITDEQIISETRKFAIGVMLSLFEDMNILDYSNRLIHPLIRVLSTCGSSDVLLLSATITGLSTFLCKLGMNYLPYILPVRRVCPMLSTPKYSSYSYGSTTNTKESKVPQLDEYEAFILRLLRRLPLPEYPSDYYDIRISKIVKNQSSPMNEGVIEMNMSTLESAWTINMSNPSSNDLTDWLQRFATEFIRQNPNPYIRLCTPLVKANRLSAEQLLNASFHCIWESLYYGESTDVLDDISLITAIETALKNSNVTRDIIVCLLNVCEFMDMQDKILPIDVKLLAKQAESANMFARCLRYREIEFNSMNISPSYECVESLITVNHELGLVDKATGVLLYIASNCPQISVRPVWLEKLLYWNDALDSYRKIKKETRYRRTTTTNKTTSSTTMIGGDGGGGGGGGDNDISHKLVVAVDEEEINQIISIKHDDWLSCELGEMRCLHALGEYEELVTNAQTFKDEIVKNDDINNIQTWLYDVNILGASAAWSLGQWDVMSEFIEEYTINDRSDVEISNKSSFYEAVYKIHLKQYDEALDLIEMTRKNLSYAVSTLLSENYSRAYRGMVSMQILSELEEVIEYKQLASPGAILDVQTAETSNGVGGGGGDGSRHTSLRLLKSHRDKTSSIRDLHFTNGMKSPRYNSTKPMLSFDKNYAKEALLKRWRARLKWAPKEIDVYRQLLAVHTLVVDPIDDLDSWLELATMCRKENMFTLCRNILKQLGSPILTPSTTTSTDLEETKLSILGELSNDNTITTTTTNNNNDNDTNTTNMNLNNRPSLNNKKSSTLRISSMNNINSLDISKRLSLKLQDPKYAIAKQRILFASYKYLWAYGEKESALDQLSDFLKGMKFDMTTSQNIHMSEGGRIIDLQTFHVKCLLQRADWLRDMGSAPFSEVIATILEARNLAPDQYSVWHAWAVTNYNQLQKVDVLEYDLGQMTDRGGQETPRNKLLNPSFASPLNSPNPTKSRSNSASSVNGGDGDKAHSKRNNNNNNNNIKNDVYRRAGGTQGLSLANLLSVNPETDAMKYVTESIKGFVKSIVLGGGQPVAYLLQDTLRLLTLWFTYGSKDSIYTLLKTELDNVSMENWLRVIPQLIARMHVKSTKIAALLRKLLIRLADSHPQALVCPISVALNTEQKQQKQMAYDVLLEMRKHRNQLVDEAFMLSRELMRVAMTSHEVWYDGLEKAAQQYIEFKDIDSMKETLFNLHEQLNTSNSSPNSHNNDPYKYTATTPTGHSNSYTTSNHNTSFVGTPTSKYIYTPTPRDRNTPSPNTKYYSMSKVSTTVTNAAITSAAMNELYFSDESNNKIGMSILRDISFRQTYGRQIDEAYQWLKVFDKSHNIGDLHQSWEIYQIIFKKIKIQIQSLKKVELHHISPALMSVSQWTLAVPGTYVPYQDTISIHSISTSMDVIASKQRPRKMSMTGSNGIVYQFLLKGHEDLRQDERVMQLFGLINLCFDNARSTNNRGYNIVRYSVLPLSNNSGVIGWVENCDTMNQLIKQYRELKGIKLNTETKLLSSKCQNYNKLPILNKMEAFIHVLEETSGKDLSKMLWLKSKSADAWVERRSNYTISMAVMSMVGYILGLGDRHPSNLMIDRITGRVVHIDFGDCFEVTMKRAKFPEIIPFRLTRMLTEAMEKTGMEGTYRFTCERVMRVLRENKDSLMAMLEAFVYDPLISWRLLGNEVPAAGTNENETGVRGGGGGGITTHSYDDDDILAYDDDNDNPAKSRWSVDRDSKMIQRAVDDMAKLSVSKVARSRLLANTTAAVNVIPRSMRNSSNLGGTLQKTKSNYQLKGIKEDQVSKDIITKGNSSNGDLDMSLHNNEEEDDDEEDAGTMNARALEVITRIEAKLSGRDFAKSSEDIDLDVDMQVDRLIKEATSIQNLCQLYSGWCPLW